jgi:DNA repair ATPase RecN
MGAGFLAHEPGQPRAIELARPAGIGERAYHDRIRQGESIDCVRARAECRGHASAEPRGILAGFRLDCEDEFFIRRALISDARQRAGGDAGNARDRLLVERGIRRRE